MEVKLVDTTGAALRLGVSRSLLEKLRMSEDAGPAYVRFGRAVRYRLVDLDLWAAANLTKGGGR